MEESVPLNWLHLGIGLGALAILALVADWLKSRLITRTVGRVASEAQIPLDDGPLNTTVLLRLAPIVPAIVVYYGIVPALGVTQSEVEAGTETQILIVFWTAVRRLSAAYIALTIARTLVAAFDAFSAVYHRTSPASIAKPIKSYVQVFTLAVYAVAAVVIVAILLGRSPVAFLSGIGALTALLMLVFRNTLVSLAASIQITANDILRIGDWVEIPHANANGTVIEIDLHMTRVQNWDKTISTIPNHRLIGDSFKNWRGMSESGGRRIKRAILIDVNSVRFLEAGEIDRLAGHKTVSRYLNYKLHEITDADAKATGQDEPSGTQAGKVTNLEIFRAYVEGYLRAHPKTHREMTLMVRQLAPGPHGAPIELYCFSNDTEWLSYEAFQSEIFDHLFAILPEFGLRAFQERSGSDLPRREEPLSAAGE
ncbi:MAG: mechanosensitive ion channel [Gemmatimonadetes bacterium]|nr:mechanosensitive ion channel [Gemmatimonadota bacterium]MYG21317.1 mechanosensitive ion channel [Gemmatimonadota bacterium]MYJ40147.1 mechanosensitive ion channel [Gemmatimonadota bacterium]